MAFEETSRHKSNSNMHTKLANQHFCKIPKNQADLHFIIFDVVVRIATNAVISKYVFSILLHIMHFGARNRRTQSRRMQNMNYKN